MDKLHIQGHKGQCLTKYDPYLFTELKNANTIVCEQINFRIGSHKFSIKHMNSFRYPFYLYIIFNEYNKITSEGRFEINQIKLNTKKRIYDEFDEDDLD